MTRPFMLVILGLLVPLGASGQDSWKPRIRAGDLRIDLTGYVQFDFVRYPNWTTAPEDRADESELRRARVGLEGEWGPLSFEVDVDPQGLSPDADADDDATYLKDAFADFRITRSLHLRGGNFKLPVSPESLTSGAKTDFLERSLAVRWLAPARDLGLMAHGQVRKLLLYQVGVFAGDGRKQVERAGVTGAGRLVVSPVKGLDVGASFMLGEVEAAPEVPGGNPDPKGFLGKGETRFTFSPRHFVNGRRRRIDVEASYVFGSAAIRGEFLQAYEERQGQGALFDDLPAVAGTGWVVSGTWLVTGEEKKRTITPKSPLARGAGAIEIGARFERLRFDDVGPDDGFESSGNRARNVRPKADSAIVGGVSWWPTGWSRVMLNVAAERYLDPLFAPEPGRAGNYVSVLLRLQLQAP